MSRLLPIKKKNSLEILLKLGRKKPAAYSKLWTLMWPKVLFPVKKRTHHLDQRQVLALSAMIHLRNNVAQIVNKLGIVVGSVKQSTGLVIRLDVLTSKRNKKVSNEVVSNLVFSLCIS